MKNSTAAVKTVKASKTAKTSGASASSKKTQKALEMDPELMTELSDAFQDCFFNDEGSDDKVAKHHTFKDRLQTVKAHGDDWGDADLSVAIGALVEKAKTEFRRKDLQNMMRSPSGMRLMCTLQTQMELRAYSRMVTLTAEEIQILTAKGPISFQHYPLITAAGAWAQTTRYEAETGLTSAENLATADALFAALSELESFKLGRNLAGRVWLGVEASAPRRGRRSLDHMDRLFSADEEGDEVDAQNVA